jgi:exodeoxyribonuclease V beta subunit
MEFHYPIKPIKPETIVRLFQEHGRPFVKQMPSQHWRRLNFSPVHGFMKGFIDMIFEYNGRYYLVDWKSNHLGNAYEDYQTAVIEAAMGDAFYYLQYHLYTVALDRWLQSRVEGYRYDRHFGGVFYLFIRGIDHRERDCGIFYDLPEPEMVTSLRETLLGV